MSERIELTYWPLQGLGAACRLSLIHAVGIDGFVDTHETDSDAWAAKTAKIAANDNPLVNMPFIKFGDSPTITQSNAVLKAIGRRFNLLGVSIADQDLTDEVLWQLADFHTEYVKLTYVCPKEHFEVWKVEFDQRTIPYYYGGLDKLLALRKVEWFGGSAVSVADFKLYCYAMATRVLHGRATVAEELACYPNLAAWAARMDALPSVQTFLASPMGKLHCNGFDANWDPIAWPADGATA